MPTRSTPPPASQAQRRFEEVSGRRRTHFCGAYWGWGFHEDGVRSALRVAETLGGRLRRDGELHLRGDDPPPADRAAARVPPPPGAVLPRPRRAAAAARRPADERGGPACCASAAATISVRPRLPLDHAVRDARAAADRAVAARADPAPHPAPLVRALLQPGQLLLLPRRSGRAGRGGRRRGHEHAVGRASRLRPAPWVRGTSARRCTCRRSWGWTTATPRAPASRASAWPSTSRAAARARSGSTPRSRCAGASSRRAPRRRWRSATRSRTSACSR